MFAATLFLCAFLLFWLEPLISKAILPLLGGAPAVWNTALVFFQAALLLGYLYAHGLARRFSTRASVLVHGVLIAAACLFLPPSVPAGWTPPTEVVPVPWVLALLAVAIGVPFLALAATAPLLQAWWARTGAPSADDPYRLYAASNAGSLVALLAFPVVLEPVLSLGDQATLWSGVFLAAGLLVLACGVRTARSHDRVGATGTEERHGSGDRSEPSSSDADEDEAIDLDEGERLDWIALAFAPAAHLHAVTAHLTTDVAAVPLLWVLPLALYLATFVVAYARRGARLRRLARLYWIWVALPMIPLFFIREPVVAPFHLVAFAVLALACHAELARRRPPSDLLTEYYLWIAAGGLGGGVLVGVAAPYLFDGVPEYPLAFALACALAASGQVRSGIGSVTDWRLRDLVLPAFIGAAGLACYWLLRAIEAQTWLWVVAVALAGGAVYASRGRPLRLGGSIGALLVWMAAWTTPGGEVIFEERSYFGVVRVIESPDGDVRRLRHGTTLHGLQLTDREGRTRPLGYYGLEGPAGEALRTARSASKREPAGLRIGVAGLGAGSLACHRSSGDTWTFFEIDPVVIRVARDPSLFTYLRDCAPEAEIVAGDARLSLRRQPADAYDVLAMDAFSSASVPVHLLTQEALAMYDARLSEGGLLLFHLSNRHMNLVPVVARLAAEGGWSVLIRRHDPAENGEGGGRYLSPSLWAALTRSDSIAADLRDEGWRTPDDPTAGPLWTDRHTSLLEVIRW